MARVPLLSESDLAPDDQEVLARPINLYRVLAHVPELARRYRSLGKWFRYESSLDPRLRELAILQVGIVIGDRYETSHHIRVGAEFGVSDDDVRAVGLEARGEPNDLDARERLVLRAARELTVTQTVEATTWAGLAEWMPDSQRVELVAVIGYYNMTIRIIGALEIDVEDSYLRELDRFPALGM